MKISPKSRGGRGRHLGWQVAERRTQPNTVYAPPGIVSSPDDDRRSFEDSQRRALVKVKLMSAFTKLGLALLVSLALIVVGCSSMPPVEFCYVHPTYGQVCVSVGGKKYMDPALTPEQRAEVEKWLKTQPTGQ